MKNIFTSPEIEVTYFTGEDVITGSGTNTVYTGTKTDSAPADSSKTQTVALDVTKWVTNQ